MATISGPEKNNKSEMTVRITDTQRKRSFEFQLHGNHIIAVPLNPGSLQVDEGAKIDKRDWYNLLTEDEKLNVFNRILATYRQRSQGENGVQLAALGITESGKIYIAENTEQLSNDYHRQCAEQNMVTISTQRDVYDQITEAVKAGTDARQFHAKTPKYRDVYMMGGRDGDKDLQIACPCGNCTDLLSKVMLDNSHIWVLPVSEGNLALAINSEAKLAQELDLSGQDGKPKEAWKTTIRHLDNERTIPLDGGRADLQREALKAFISHAGEWIHKPILTNPNEACGMPADLAHGWDDEADAQTSGYRTPPVDLAKLNDFMSSMINRTLANRLVACAKKRHMGKLSELNAEDIEKLIVSDVQWVRCAVIQRDDGMLYAAVMSKSVVDNALPNVEVVALGQAGDQLGTRGMQHVWAMSMYPHRVHDGNMRTSPKESAERLLKRRSQMTGSIDFHFIPYNEGGLSQEYVQAITEHRPATTVFPSYFRGKGKSVLQPLAPATQVVTSALICEGVTAPDGSRAK